MAVVAAVLVAITAAVSLRQVHDVARGQAFDALDRQGGLVGGVLEDRPGVLGRPGQLLVLQDRFLARQRIRLVGVTARGRAVGQGHTLVAPADAAALLDGGRLRTTRTAGGHAYLLVGRPVPAGAVVLVQDGAVVGQLSQPASRRLLLGLLAGLVVAGLVGALLARRLSRPLRTAAGAAHAMAAGARDVRLPVTGPREVAELSGSLNTLAQALTLSEGRQRDFLLSVSHELRTPLTAVRGLAEGLDDGVIPAEEAAVTGATIAAESRRLERLVSDLLDLARLDAVEFRVDLSDADLVELARAAADVWSVRCAAEGVRLVAELPGVPVPVRTDPARVRQIVDGLAENALRVVPAGAPVVLAVRGEGAWAVLEVRDGGPGLEPSDYAVAFDRSALYDRYRGIRRVGTGLGLAIVAGLARRLDGQVSAGPAPEGGAAFTVRLPRA